MPLPVSLSTGPTCHASWSSPRLPSAWTGMRTSTELDICEMKMHLQVGMHAPVHVCMRACVHACMPSADFDIREMQMHRLCGSKQTSCVCSAKGNLTSLKSTASCSSRCGSKNSNAGGSAGRRDANFLPSETGRREAGSAAVKWSEKREMGGGSWATSSALAAQPCFRMPRLKLARFCTLESFFLEGTCFAALAISTSCEPRSAATVLASAASGSASGMMQSSADWNTLWSACIFASCERKASTVGVVMPCWTPGEKALIIIEDHSQLRCRFGVLDSLYMNELTFFGLGV